MIFFVLPLSIIALFFPTSYMVFSEQVVPEIDIEVTDGVIDPIPVAMPKFVIEEYTSSIVAKEISKIIRNKIWLHR